MVRQSELVTRTHRLWTKEHSSIAHKVLHKPTVNNKDCSNHSSVQQPIVGRSVHVGPHNQVVSLKVLKVKLADACIGCDSLELPSAKKCEKSHHARLPS
jgi:hypothetical protein